VGEGARVGVSAGSKATVSAGSVWVAVFWVSELQAAAPRIMIVNRTERALNKLNLPIFIDNNKPSPQVSFEDNVPILLELKGL
jgi:hypothetical protein